MFLAIDSKIRNVDVENIFLLYISLCAHVLFSDLLYKINLWLLLFFCNAVLECNEESVLVFNPKHSKTIETN